MVAIVVLTEPPDVGPIDGVVRGPPTMSPNDAGAGASGDFHGPAWFSVDGEGYRCLTTIRTPLSDNLRQLHRRLHGFASTWRF